jgi:hypothetical protein
VNWDAIGAIAETLGAIGVIASLAYVAGQIRQSREQMSQNTRAMKAGAYQQLHEFIGESANSLPSPEMELVRRGSDDFHQLDEQDAYRFGQWALRMVITLEGAHYQYRIGMLDEDRWRLFRSALQGYFTFPGFRRWWKVMEGGLINMLSPEFAALVEEILAEEPDRGE